MRISKRKQSTSMGNEAKEGALRPCCSLQALLDVFNLTHEQTDYVCHTAPVENAVNIFKGGSLQASTKWRGVGALTLKAEDRNAANDPEVKDRW